VVTFSAKGDLISYDGTTPVVVPIGTVPSQVPTVDPASPYGWSWQAQLSSYAASFSTIYAVDFSTLPPANLLTGGDGVKTINTKTWNLVNSVNAQTCYLNDGTHAGLYMRCNTNNVNNNNGNLAGVAMYIPLATIAASLALNNWSELWLMYMIAQPHVPNATYEYIEAGLITTPTSYAAANLNRFRLGNGYGGAGRYAGQMQVTFAGGSSAYAGGFATAAVYDVVCLRLIGGMVESYYGQSVAGAFPAISTLLFSARSTIGGSAGIVTFDGWQCWFSVSSSNGAGASDLLLQKMQILTR
jgi:hypothetical protein